MIWDLILTFMVSWGLNAVFSPVIVEDAKPKEDLPLHMHIGDKLSEMEPHTIKVLNESEHWSQAQSRPEDGPHFIYEIRMLDNKNGFFKVTFDKTYHLMSITEDWEWASMGAL